MKSVSPLSVLNRKPVIIVDNHTLQSIKHITKIAPQEAQWFHTVTPELPKGQSDRVYLRLSSKLYIPKQNTSLAQVDSSSSMMIEFYNELKQEHDDQAVINNILTSMTCWCHSHHNMAPNPSAQDVAQFNFFVKSSIEQQQNNYQVMLIFNKRDEFYSRVYDPTTGIIFEGVDIIEYHNYDFSYIDKAAKDKFLKPKPKKLVSNKIKSTSYNKSATAYDPVLPSWMDQNSLWGTQESEYDNDFVDLVVDDAVKKANAQFRIINGKKDIARFTERGYELFFEELKAVLDPKEYVWLHMLLTDNKNQIPKSFTDAAFAKANFDLYAMEEDLKYDMLNEGIHVGEFKRYLDDVFNISDLTYAKTVTNYVKDIA